MWWCSRHDRHYTRGRTKRCHLRSIARPALEKRALVECGRALKSALAAFHVPLIINDHADVCLAVDAEGLHIGQDDLSPSDARAIIGNESY